MSSSSSSPVHNLGVAGAGAEGGILPSSAPYSASSSSSSSSAAAAPAAAASSYSASLSSSSPSSPPPPPKITSKNWKCRALLVDHYDSFSHNLAQQLHRVFGVAPLIVHCDAPWARVKPLLAQVCCCFLVLYFEFIFFRPFCFVHSVSHLAFA